MKGAASRPMPSTTCSIVSVAGDQRSTALHTTWAAAKLIRVASRPPFASPRATADRASAPKTRVQRIKAAAAATRDQVGPPVGHFAVGRFQVRSA